MLKLIVPSLLILCLTFACKTSDSPQSQPATSLSEQAMEAPATSTQSTTSLDRETQHKFDAFVKQGDNNYAEGNFREALNFYKKAQSIAPDQLGKDKLIACIKAMQVPSTRRK